MCPSVFAGTDIDDEELEKELEELEQEELDKELLGVGPSATDELPDVPSAEPREKAKQKKPTPVEEEEDKDMKLLMSWAQ